MLLCKLWTSDILPEKLDERNNDVCLIGIE